MRKIAGALRNFVDIRKHEVQPAALFFGFWFLAIVVFQILKPLKKGLFVEQLGAYVELYAKLVNVGVALGAVVGFTALYDRLGTRRLIPALCGLFIVGLLGFGALFAVTTPGILTSWVFYLFGDLWSTLWVTTFWAYLNEMTRTDQSKRLYGVIGAGGVIGGLVGGLLVWNLVRPFGAPVLLVGAAVATGIIGLLVWRTERIAARPDAPIGRHDTDRLGVQSAQRPREQDGRRSLARRFGPVLEGGRLVASSRYLMAIVSTVLLYELVSQLLDYQYATEAEKLQGTGATQQFFGMVTAIIGAVSVGTQLFLVSFVMRRLGMTTALLVLPVAMAIASGIYVAVPVLWAAALLSISDNALSYSMNQTARETLYVPTSPDVKYKARAFANMLVQRFGKAVAILMALGLGAVPVRYLSFLSIGVVLLWIAIATSAGRRFEHLTKTQGTVAARQEP